MFSNLVEFMKNIQKLTQSNSFEVFVFNSINFANLIFLEKIFFFFSFFMILFFFFCFLLFFYLEFRDSYYFSLNHLLKHLNLTDMNQSKMSDKVFNAHRMDIINAKKIKMFKHIFFYQWVWFLLPVVYLAGLILLYILTIWLMLVYCKLYMAGQFFLLFFFLMQDGMNLVLFKRSIAMLNQEWNYFSSMSFMSFFFFWVWLVVFFIAIYMFVYNYALGVVGLVMVYFFFLVLREWILNNTNVSNNYRFYKYLLYLFLSCVIGGVVLIGFLHYFFCLNKLFGTLTCSQILAMFNCILLLLLMCIESKVVFLMNYYRDCMISTVNNSLEDTFYLNLMMVLLFGLFWFAWYFSILLYYFLFFFSLAVIILFFFWAYFLLKFSNKQSFYFWNRVYKKCCFNSKINVYRLVGLTVSFTMIVEHFF